MAGDLPKDEATIQRAKGPEFYSLGLVLGYSYAGSPVIQPSAGPPDLTDATTYRPTTDPGARLPHCWLADGTSLYDHLGPGFTLLCPPAADARPGGRHRAPPARPRPPSPAHRARGAAVLPLAGRVPARPARPAHRLAGGRPR